MIDKMVEYLSAKKKVLFLTTSNRWEGENELPKSTQLAYQIAQDLSIKGCSVEVLEVPKLNIYPCEGNVSSLKGNTCGLKDALLKDTSKNPSGYHRCWASINNPDDELWKVSKELFDSEAVVFFISVRWGQANGYYQKLIERLNWIENMHTTLQEENEVRNIEAGCVVIGQNWRGEEVLETQKEVYRFYGFKVPSELSFNWQYTQDADDETQESYQKAPKAFELFFDIILKGAKKIKESMKFLGFSEFLNENSNFPHQIKSEDYWRKVLQGNKYALDVLDTIMKRQQGRASDRQMNILRKGEKGDRTPYSTKN